MNAESHNYLTMDGGWTVMERGKSSVKARLHVNVLEQTFSQVRQLTKIKDHIYRMVKVQVQQNLTKPNYCI